MELTQTGDQETVQDKTKCWILDCEYTPEKYCSQCIGFYCIHHCHFQKCENCSFINDRVPELTAYRMCFPSTTLVILVMIALFCVPIIIWNVETDLLIFRLILGLFWGHGLLLFLVSITFYVLSKRRYHCLKGKLVQQPSSSLILPVRSIKETARLKQKVEEAEKIFYQSDKFFDCLNRKRNYKHF